jgi:hypothetical protein
VRDAPDHEPGRAPESLRERSRERAPDRVHGRVVERGLAGDAPDAIRSEQFLAHRGGILPERAGRRRDKIERVRSVRGHAPRTFLAQFADTDGIVPAA